jgi:hypothetical protein
MFSGAAFLFHPGGQLQPVPAACFFEDGCKVGFDSTNGDEHLSPSFVKKAISL